ncbi:DUF6207 family protein [Streptomyces sp. BK239]|uniref:DUF6207 family protein n=1 Tax=Streptomyces sp. BK239 TaxID=2512155 RepID=UPI001F5F2241|nr:DUF6207 family protein [Streptomyces sp. BK239]
MSSVADGEIRGGRWATATDRTTRDPRQSGTRLRCPDVRHKRSTQPRRGVTAR